MQVIDPFEFLFRTANPALTTLYQLDAEEGLRASDRNGPVRCEVSTLGSRTYAEILSREDGACFSFRTPLGRLPFTAQAPEARALVLDVLRKLHSDIAHARHDLNISLDSMGAVHLRGSLTTADRPTLSAFFTALAEYAQAARPFLLELRPLLH